MQRATLFGFIASLAIATTFSDDAWSAPCVSPVSSCSEWLSVPGTPGRLLLYRNHPLDTKNDLVTGALIVVHGASRDADNYYRSAIAAGFLADALEMTIIIAPRFAAGKARSDEGRECGDKLAADELTVGVPITYVAANPSSYTYLDVVRPTAAAMTSRYPALPPGYQPAAPPSSQKPFVEFADAKACTGYNQWPYGLEGRVGYTRNISDSDLKQQLTARPVTYMLGELDILPLYTFDASCAAMAQGPTRLARGVAYTKYVTETLGARHQQILVPACGHNARCMLGSEAALPVLFPKR